MRILLAGASPELLALAQALGHEVVVVADPSIEEPDWLGVPFTRDDAAAVKDYRPHAAAVAIDDPRARNRVHDALGELNLPVLSLVGGYLGEGTAHGDGLVVQRLAHLSERCRVGRGLRLNVGANVMHDNRLGEFVTVAPNAVLLGGVAVGDHSYIGANATLLPGITVGRGCTVGAGAVVTNDVPDGATVKGSPAK